MEASDGSKQVKVWLHCPSCRSDLTYTIRDTLLLRKVDELLHLLREHSDDVTLRESQVRLKDALEQSQEVKTAAEESRRREAQYLGQPLLESLDASERGPLIEEWGVEADIVTGAHDSFRCPKAPKPAEEGKLASRQTDITLFGGLDYFISADCDRIDLTELMTSGDPNKLAEGAKILAGVAKSVGKLQPAQESQEPTKKARARYLVKRSSVFELIAEVKEAHEDEEKHKFGFLPSHPQKPQGPSRYPSMSRVREAKQDVQRMAEHQRKFPLPVRMPKCVEIDATARDQLRFIDNEWDGTVIDAYSKLTIGFNQRVSQRQTTHSGVRNVLGDGEVRVDFSKPRILLASVTKEMGKQGATKGDVVTHIQGEAISGKTMNEIQGFLEQVQPDRCGSLSMVLNAERSVAEALKRRAMAMAEQIR